ncbi:MAG: hypothetical protein RL007_487 [Bacteroidota bacterium]|jgi:hypothetical protein
MFRKIPVERSQLTRFGNKKIPLLKQRDSFREGKVTYIFLTLTAFSPLRPSATSKDTLSPEFTG